MNIWQKMQANAKNIHTFDDLMAEIKFYIHKLAVIGVYKKFTK